MYYLYRHIRLDKNEPFYIGIGKNFRNEFDFRRATENHNSNRIWKSIVSKTKIEVEIIYVSYTKEEIIRKEIEFISLYGRIDLGTGTLCNFTKGGDGMNGASPEVRDKCRKRMIGNTIMNGRKLSDEIKKRMSNSHKGQKISHKALESLRKRNVGNKYGTNNKGRKLSEELKNKLSDIKNRNPIGEKPLVCINTGVKFKSIQECSNIMFDGKKYNNNRIGSVCSGKILDYNGYNFKFI